MFNEGVEQHHKKIIEDDIKRLQQASIMAKAEIEQQVVTHLANALFDTFAKIKELESRIDVIKQNRSLSFDEKGEDHG